MKKVLLFLIIIGYGSTLWAQDVIILRNGTEIPAIIEEVGIDNVRYRRFDHQDGPVFVLSRSEIFMILYENGRREIFNEATPATLAQEQTTMRQQQLPALTHSFGRPINPHGQERNQFLAGFLSFLVPGVGQFYNGDIGGGFLFLGCNILMNSLWMTSISVDWYGYVSVNTGQFAIGFLGAITTNILSIVHASRGARNVNIVRGFRLAENTHFQILPTVIQQNDLATNQRFGAYGMSFSLNF